MKINWIKLLSSIIILAVVYIISNIALHQTPNFVEWFILFLLINTERAK